MSGKLRIKDCSCHVCPPCYECENSYECIVCGDFVNRGSGENGTCYECLVKREALQNEKAE